MRLLDSQTDSETEVSMGVWFYWALFCGSPGIICTWGKKNNNLKNIKIITCEFEVRPYRAGTSNKHSLPLKRYTEPI